MSPTKIVLVGEAKGADEERMGGGTFVGGSGAALLRMLNDAGVISLTSFDKRHITDYFNSANPQSLDAVWNLHPEVARTNVFQFHPPGNDLSAICGTKADGVAGIPPLLKSKYLRKEFEPELDRLAAEILEWDPNIVICLGGVSLWALAGQSTITKFRGTTLLSTHTVAGFKLLPTYHPAAVIREWKLRPTVIADLMKANREAAFPEIRRPARDIWIEPSLDDIREFIRTQVLGCDLLSVDIETSGSRITCIGFAPHAGAAIVIPFDDGRSKNGSYWPTPEVERTVWDLLAGVLANPAIPKLFQNGLYDIGFLYRGYGLKVMGAAEDTMLLHHALQPEMKKDLGTLGSLYCNERMWKHMRARVETSKRDN